jgi:hypothetical protein
MNKSNVLQYIKIIHDGQVEFVEGMNGWSVFGN